MVIDLDHLSNSPLGQLVEAVVKASVSSFASAVAVSILPLFAMTLLELAGPRLECGRDISASSTIVDD